MPKIHFSFCAKYLVTFESIKAVHNELMKTQNTFHLPTHWADDTIKILLVGAGGTGSQLADQLASMQATLRHLGHPGFDVTVADGDTVSPFNLGRQRFAQPDVGLNKATILLHRLNLFYNVDWTALPDNVKPANISRGVDLLITCTDSASFRAKVHSYYKGVKTDALWLDCGNADKNGQVILGHLGQPHQAKFTGNTAITRLPNIVDLYPELRTQTQDYDADSMPSCSTEQALTRQDFPINRMAAVAAIDILWSLLRHGQCKTHGVQFQSNPFSTQPMHISPESWSFYGYATNTAKPKSKET